MKNKKNSNILIPRVILEKALVFGSLYGSTTTDNTKHAQIPTLKLIVEKGVLKAYGKRKDSLCIFYLKLFDKGIKGDGEVYIGDVIKLIGGRDINKNRFTGIISRLDDEVEIEIVSNQVLFDKDKDYDVSISLIDEKVAKPYIIPEDEFNKKIVFDDGEIIALMGDPLDGYCTMDGIHLKEIMEDEKTTSTEFLHFNMESEDSSFRMKLGNSERSSRRKIPYDNKNMTIDIDGYVYNGIEAFANALDGEKPFDIYFKKDKAFVFYQKTPEHEILMMSGVKKI